jgi:hypothetical protein
MARLAFRIKPVDLFLTRFKKRTIEENEAGTYNFPPEIFAWHRRNLKEGETNHLNLDGNRPFLIFARFPTSADRHLEDADMINSRSRILVDAPVYRLIRIANDCNAAIG